MWFVLALATAVFFTGQSAAAKPLSKRYGSDLITWTNFLFSVPLYAVLLALHGIPAVEPSFWGWLLVGLATNLLAMPMFFRALEVGELSIVLPLATLTPLFALGTEFLLLGDAPTPLAVLGVVLVVGGSYLLQAPAVRRGPLGPVRALLHDRGARLALGTAALWSISAVTDRAAVLASSPPFYLAVFAVAFSVAFFPWLAWRRRRSLRLFARKPWPTAAVAVLGACMATCQMTALDMALASMVISIKRLAALFGVLAGSLAFRESGLAHRLPAALVMTTGAVLLALS